MKIRPPIPVARLVEQVCDDGSDYDDGIMGCCSGRFEGGILTLTFQRDNEADADADDDWAGATYRFKLTSGEAT